MLPVVLAIIFVAIQAALVEHGRHVALAIAQRADRAGRAYVAGDPSAQQVQATRRQAAQTLATALTPALGGDALHDVAPLTTTFAGDGSRLSVTVRAKVSGPFGDMTVSQTAAGPVELFVTGT